MDVRMSWRKQVEEEIKIIYAVVVYFGTNHISIINIIGIRRTNCYVICFLNHTCHHIWEETYISNITSFPALSVLMSTNV